MSDSSEFRPRSPRDEDRIFLEWAAERRRLLRRADAAEHVEHSDPLFDRAYQVDRRILRVRSRRRIPVFAKLVVLIGEAEVAAEVERRDALRDVLGFVVAQPRTTGGSGSI